MDQLRNAPEEQKIAALYSIIRQDPDFLQAFDQKQFAETPLHSAAKHGWTGLALEIQRLMPSFGRKLNPDGFSPLHLALLRGNAGTVSAMIKLEPELVAVQGKEGFTPLHYAANMGDVDLLAEFLLRCPDAIDKLTVRNESAVHVAVKGLKFEAFRLLLRWLKRTRRTGVLIWRDVEGNAVLHLAASTNQHEVVELLLTEGGPVRVNDKNSRGLTALDMVGPLTGGNTRTLQILQRSGARNGLSIRDLNIYTFADCLSSKVTKMETIIEWAAYIDVTLQSEMRNTILVVGTLIATATYQGVLSPPNGSGSQAPISTNTTSNATGHVVTAETARFTAPNFVALTISLTMIAFVLPIDWFYSWLHLSLICFIMIFMAAAGSQLDYTFILVSFIVLSLISFVKTSALRTRNMQVYRWLIGSNNLFNIQEVITQACLRSYSRKNIDGKI